MTSTRSTASTVVRLFMCLAAAIIGGFGILLLTFQVSVTHSNAVAQMQEVATLIAQTSELSVSQQRPESVQEALDAMDPNPWMVSVAIFDSRGSELGHRLGMSALQSCYFDGLGWLENALSLCHLSVVVPVRWSGLVVGHVELIGSMASYWKGLLAVNTIWLTISLFALLLTWIFVRGAAARLVAPIRQLSSTVGVIANTNDYSIRIQAAGTREVVALAIAFNDLLTQLEDRDNKLEALALVDDLTGLNNRRAFHQHLQRTVGQASGTGTHCALVMIDLDGFKAVNDQFGHAAGDAVLVAVGKRLRNCLRQSDFICRLGGDEFAVVMGGFTRVEPLKGLVEAMRLALAQPYDFENHRLAPVTGSLGVAIYPTSAKSIPELVRKADEAMYAAKRDDPGCVKFSSVDRLDLRSREEILEAALAEAVSRDQLYLVFQPQFRVVHDHQAADADIRCSLHGFEALVRWQHPELGTISPAEFIPMAERRGLIAEIGEWVLVRAVESLEGWISHHGAQHISLSVNLSGQQLMDEQAIERLLNFAKDKQLPPGLVELELTESVLVNPSRSVIQRMQSLRDVGFGLAMDDFGIGYSSLSRLEDFPLSTLKIDRHFVGKLLTPGHNHAVTHAIVSMAKELDLLVIAEGVEEWHQLRLLAKMGCELFQGYLFPPPVGYDESLSMLAGDFSTCQAFSGQTARV